VPNAATTPRNGIAVKPASHFKGIFRSERKKIWDKMLFFLWFIVATRLPENQREA
jgi:hypothetical protein